MKKLIATSIWTITLFSCALKISDHKENAADDKPIAVHFTQAQKIDTLLDVGGYKLHFNIVKGNGLPIIFESGGGNDGTVWQELLQPLYDSLDATLITYDRAGFGSSGIDTTNINVMSEIEGLERGLKKLGYTQNLLLVSHSLGGAYAALFASKNKQRISGSVFIDIILPCYMNQEKTQESIDQMAAYGIDNIKAMSPGFYYIFKNYKHTNEVLRKTDYRPIFLQQSLVQILPLPW